MSTSLLSLPAASLLVSVTSGPGAEAGGGATGPDICTGGLGDDTERPKEMR